mgnify:CR=1 FL=1
MQIYNEKKNCSGCSACYSICPMHCIEMKYDYEGFSYPYVDSAQCVKCGLCAKVCPIQEEGYLEVKNSIHYAVQNKDKDIRRFSTSGGAFGVLADSIIENGGSVWGVGFDSNVKVIHKRAVNRNELADMYGSKYVQSDLNDTFFQIQRELSENKYVLFIGTPCQTEGLINYIGKNNSYLLTADFICYGVPSPKLYMSWLRYIEKKYQKKISKVIFRDKKYGYAGSNTKIVFQNGEVLEDRLDVKSYLKSMFIKLGLRPSCYECRFRTSSKKCDFTLGDMWEIGKYKPELDDDKGTTHLQIHTEKGRRFFENIMNRIEYYDVTGLVKTVSPNKQIVISIPEQRENFFKDAVRMEYGVLMKKYLPFSRKDKIASVVKPIIVKIPCSHVLFKTIKKIKMKKQNRM